MTAQRQIELDFDDPTIFAICSGSCCQHKSGSRVGNYFGKAYTERKWKKHPKCDNCKSLMVKVHEVERRRS